MGITLDDCDDDSNFFFVSFWHWRAIVEAIRALDLLDEETVNGLQDPFCDNGLDREQATMVADAIEQRLLPVLREDQRLMLDGTVTDEPDDGVFHRIEIERNYSTNAEVLKRFVAYCRSTKGFKVN